MQGVGELLAVGKQTDKQLRARLERLAELLNQLREAAMQASYEEEAWLENLRLPRAQA